jgi:hypothetical protein
VRISKVVSPEASGWSRGGGAARGQEGWDVKELIMVRLEKNDPLMLARQLPIKTVALILAGGRGTRLKDLNY